METIFAPSRRSLPPVPRPSAERCTHEAAAAVAPVVEVDDDAAQAFVARLRAAAPEFAAAAGARSAIVREAVPPARHRRARCRVVLRSADGGESDLTFLGPAGRPGTDRGVPFDEAVQRWLGAGQQRGNGWIVPDGDAPDGVAVDVTAWLTAG